MDPELVPSSKSPESVVPLLVQYNVPVPKLVVVMVQVTEEPSFTDNVDGDMLYVGGSPGQVPQIGFEDDQELAPSAKFTG